MSLLVQLSPGALSMKQAEGASGSQEKVSNKNKKINLV